MIACMHRIIARVHGVVLLRRALFGTLSRIGRGCRVHMLMMSMIGMTRVRRSADAGGRP